MKAGWEVKPLGEVCEVQNGGTLKSNISEYWGEDVAWLTPKDMGKLDTPYVSDTPRKISHAGLAKCSAKLVPAGSVIMSTRAPIGHLAINAIPMAFNQGCRGLTPNSDLELKYLYYFLYSNVEELNLLGTGATFKELAGGVLKSFEIPIPPLEEQKRIVAVLDAAFEGLARAADHAETNLQNARALFEAALLSVFSKFEGQSDQKLLKEIALDFGRGKSKHRPRNAPFLYGGPYPFVQTGDVRNSEHQITEYKQTYSEKGLAQSKLWPVDTLCITIAANIAETAILSFDACFPDSIIGVVPDPKQTSSRYLEYLLQFFQKRLKARGEGAAQQNINLATFETEYFPFTSLAKQDEVIEALDNVSAVVQSAELNYTTKLADIADLRQSLLQKAFAGELT